MLSLGSDVRMSRKAGFAFCFVGMRKNAEEGTGFVEGFVGPPDNRPAWECRTFSHAGSRIAEFAISPVKTSTFNAGSGVNPIGS